MLLGVFSYTFKGTACRKSISDMFKPFNIFQKSFFGCDVHVGICPDTSATKIEFFDNSAYRRTINRGNSPAFECMDLQDITVQANAALDSSSIENTKSLAEEAWIIIYYCDLIIQ